MENGMWKGNLLTGLAKQVTNRVHKEMKQEAGKISLMVNSSKTVKQSIGNYTLQVGFELPRVQNR